MTASRAAKAARAHARPSDITLQQLIDEILPGYRLVTFDGTAFTLEDEEGERIEQRLSELLQDLADVARDGGC